MLSKKSMKIISIVAFVVMALLAVGNVALAAKLPEATDPQVTDSLNSTVGTILGIIRWGGLILAVIVAMFIGIKFITASPEGKAEVKKTAIFYIAGIVILLSASVIVTVIGNSIQPNSIA